MKKLTSNCDYPNLILSVLWFLFNIFVLFLYIATAEKVELKGIGTCLFWMIFPVALFIGLYKEGTKER